MRKIITYGFALLFIPFLFAGAGDLTGEYQQNLIAQMQYLRGEGPLPASLQNLTLPHCGTPIAFELFTTRENLTAAYADAKALLQRPSLTHSVVSPDSLFQVHFDAEGTNAVFMSFVDTLHGGNGVPDFVDKIAEIADSVWRFEIDHLGFDAPPSDGVGGGDSLMDVYILDLGGGYYGYTAPEEVISNQSMTSYIAIDNDFDIWPYNESDELDRRLDAGRVTLAHEFFHTIHFAYDYTETGPDYALYWWEMSATWMEEMAYDDINDYYFYLSYFFDELWTGLQSVSFDNSLHQYGAAVFPIFLTEKFDTSIVKDIWQRCRDYGVGEQFTMAADDAIFEMSGGLYDLQDAFHEFAIWNVFGGQGAMFAPPGYSYSEAEHYPEIPEENVLQFVQYENHQLIWPDWPDSLQDGTLLEAFKKNMPQNLSVHYISMANLDEATDSIYLFGDANIDWSISFLGIGHIINEVEIMQTFTAAGGEIVGFDIPDSGYFGIAAVLTPVTNEIDDYPARHGYSILFKDALTGVEENDNSSVLPDGFALWQNRPNPFNAGTAIEYSLPRLSHVTIDVFNILGRKVSRLVDRKMPAGRHSVTWDGTNFEGEPVSSGIYLYRLKAGDYVKTRKMNLLK
ncbi:MAG: T9SS type A sorting domain-containing protein [Candidatus Zixiibacteriota bacterium]|nr:MAG: T9SS type A sorting domain-containing protein [candidate division Zixibacteria bacterium]